MTNEKRPIDAIALGHTLRVLSSQCYGSFTGEAYERVLKLVENAPTVDANPVKHGRWEHDSVGFSDFWVCSACREAWFFEEDPVNESTRVNYCPNCGADMRERKNNG